MKKELRDKVFCIIMAIILFVYPLTLLFDVYEHKHSVVVDGVIKRVVDKYNLINVNNVSNFALVTSVIFIVLSLSVAILSIVEIKKNNYYSLIYRITFSSLTVISASFTIFVSFYLVSMIFMIVAAHMFLIYYDIKKNKRKLSNSLIYGITYFTFLFMMIISFGFMPK